MIVLHTGLFAWRELRRSIAGRKMNRTHLFGCQCDRPVQSHQRPVAIGQRGFHSMDVAAISSEANFLQGNKQLAALWCEHQLPSVGWTGKLPLEKLFDADLIATKCRGETSNHGRHIGKFIEWQGALERPAFNRNAVAVDDQRFGPGQFRAFLETAGRPKDKFTA